MSPNRRLPSLNGIRAFEVASRTSSLVEAAQELNVTPSAVGHQIRTLEKNLGVRLFERQANRLLLTQTGRRYAGTLTEGFDILYRATQSVRREASRRPITVSATPAMALRWLAPTLDYLRHENIADFRIDASSKEADLASGEADIDIRYGTSVAPDLFHEVLCSESVFPVCHPDYALKHNLSTPENLSEAKLLFVDDWAQRGGVWSAWHDWSKVAGIDPTTLHEAERFTEMDQAVAAAARGNGVAMGAARHLDEKYTVKDDSKLQRLFDPALEVRYCFFLVALPEVAEEPTISRLISRLSELGEKSSSILHEGAF